VRLWPFLCICLLAAAGCGASPSTDTVPAPVSAPAALAAAAEPVPAGTRYTGTVRQFGTGKVARFWLQTDEGSSFELTPGPFHVVIDQRVAIEALPLDVPAAELGPVLRVLTCVVLVSA
jgi:hypothetical protein